MNYDFPMIEKLDQILPVIEGREGFKVYKNDGFASISYRVVDKEMFFGDGYSIKRECRGIMFDKNGNIVARPYHKFFNLGENQETDPSKVDFSKSHVILEKLDGSMVFPFRIDDDRFMLATKAGPTEIAVNAYKNCVENNSNRKLWINQMLDMGITPIFEYMAPDNRIVLHYEEPRLCLTGIREMRSGIYHNIFNYEDSRMLFDMPEVYSTDILEKVQDIDGMEGIVIRFDSGHMIKVKTKWYLLRHGLLDISKNPWRVMNAYFDSDLDDALASMDGFVKDIVYETIDAFFIRVDDLYSAFIDEKNMIEERGVQRKDYAALFPLSMVDDDFRFIMPMMIFKFWDTCPSYEEFKRFVIQFVMKDKQKFKRFFNYTFGV